MNQSLLTPKELVEYLIYSSEKKLKKPLNQLFIQGILAGMFIAIGAIGYFKLVAYTTDPGLGQFLGAFVFPLGIIAILSLQAELFTSNCMIIIGSFRSRVNTPKILKRLLLILSANLVGSIIIAFLSNVSGIYSEAVLDVIIHKAIHKVHMPVDQLLFSGILCNIIVCMGMCMSYSARDTASKIMLAWLSISVFVLSGTEHVVANMYYLFTAYIGGGDITLAQILYNLFFVTIGNFIGGGVIITGMNYLISHRDIA